MPNYLLKKEFPMKTKHISSIQSKIFISYGFLILAIIILAGNLYYFTAYSGYVKNYENTSRQLSKIMSRQVDEYIERINEVQKKFLESESIREYIFEDAKAQNFLYDKAFQKIIYTISGYDFDFYHMNFLNLEDNTLITFGQRYSYVPYTITPEIADSVINPAVLLRGAKYIIPSGKGSLYKTDKTPTISLVRSFPRFSDSLSEPKGIIEIQMDYHAIESLISDTLLSYDNQAESLYIFNEKKELIFPQNAPEDLLNYYTTLDTSNKATFRNPITKENEIITSYRSQNTNFTTLVITPYSTFNQNRLFFQSVVFVIAFISFILLFTISYRLARSISLPIVKLKDRLSAFELDNIPDRSNQLPKTGLNELELLSDAYEMMQFRLKKSLHDIVQTKTLSIHAQMMALQSQMDSHFLYNTLTIISIIAEENDDTQASEMCVKLSDMLRYITQDYSISTNFSNELFHAQNYTQLMSIRFGDKICFHYQIEESLSTVSIPRLLLQPLIENSVKYSRDPNKQLIISIHTYIEGDFWFANITDNGSGFTSDSIEKIYEKIENLETQKDYTHIDVRNMGIANIYLRLKLFYESNFTFEIKNPDTGSSVKIGGSLRHDS